MNQNSSESNYFLRRASEERAAAERAGDARARQSHLDLAERYANAASDPAANGAQLALDPSVAAPLLQPEFRILP